MLSRCLIWAAPFVVLASASAARADAIADACKRLPQPGQAVVDGKILTRAPDGTCTARDLPPPVPRAQSWMTPGCTGPDACPQIKR